MLACNSEEHETAAAATLLAAAFDAFPDKDYCLLTLPPDSPEVPLLATFTRLLPPPGASLVESLYLCHRFALLEDFQVPLHVSAATVITVLLLCSMSATCDHLHCNCCMSRSNLQDAVHLCLCLAGWPAALQVLACMVVPTRPLYITA